MLLTLEDDYVRFGFFHKWKDVKRASVIYRSRTGRRAHIKMEDE